MDPRRAAEWHCDKHVVKMLLESTQLLWTAWTVLAAEAAGRLDDPAAPTPYKPTHKNHPCAVWARQSSANYDWLCALAAALIDEYHFRYGGHKIHACERHVAWLSNNRPPALPTGPLTWPALAMPPEYKISANPTACYRAYYLGAKRDLLKYTNRPVPIWVSRQEE